MMTDSCSGLWYKNLCLSFSLSVPPLPPCSSVSLSFSVLLTNAVGLQCTELEPWLAVAGVASLHRNTLPMATYGGSDGTLVDPYKKATEMFLLRVA